MRYAISYVSTKQEHLTDDEVNNILTHTEINNNQSGITGILLYSEGNFFRSLKEIKNGSKPFLVKSK